MAFSEVKKLKICVVTGRMDAGGVPVNLVRFLRMLPEDIEVFLAAPPDEPHGVIARDLIGSPRFFSLAHRALRIQEVLALAVFLKTNKIDVVSCHGKSGGIIGRVAAMLAQKPSAYFYHGVHYMSYASFGRMVYFQIERILAVFSKAIVAVSADEAELIKSLRLCSPKKIHTVLNGVPIPPSTSQLPSSPPFHFLHITRFNEQKNSDLLLEICELLRNRNILTCFQFSILGDGDALDRTRFEEQIRARGLSDSIQCLGPVKDTYPYYETAHGLLSTSRWEGLPLGVLECMACGRIPIVTQVTGHSSVVFDGENGITFPSESAESAADRLTALLTDSSQMHLLASKARASCMANYSVEKMIKGRCDIFRTVQNGTKGRNYK